MKIAVVSESPADEAAIKILVDAIVGRETEMSPLRLRPNGWPNVLELMPSLIAGLHYGTEVEAIVTVVDSDDSAIHDTSHETRQNENMACRLCLLRSTIGTVLRKVRAVPNRNTLNTGIGLAVPAIEAWYLCGIDSHVNEATWGRKLGGERITYDRQSLKLDVYGTRQPSLTAETAAAEAAARRLVENIELLELLFPAGFGCLLRDVRNW
jgi:hypothetical protein